MLVRDFHWLKLVKSIGGMGKPKYLGKSVVITDVSIGISRLLRRARAPAADPKVYAYGDVWTYFLVGHKLLYPRRIFMSQPQKYDFKPLELLHAVCSLFPCRKHGMTK